MKASWRMGRGHLEKERKITDLNRLKGINSIFTGNEEKEKTLGKKGRTDAPPIKPPKGAD